MKPINHWKDIAFDSKWEEETIKCLVAEIPGIVAKPPPIPYVRPATKHKYTPDMKLEKVFIELKGRFRDKHEWTKSLHVRETLKEGEELVFVFMKPLNPMPHVQKRKDGTKMTHAEWAEKNGFKWFTSKTIGTYLKGTKHG